MKKFITVVLVAMMFMIFSAKSAMAEPSFYGPTGLLLTPTADIATPESAWLSFNFIDYSRRGFNESVWSYSLLGGLSEEFEMGVTGFYHSESDDGFGINAKWAIMPESIETPGISLGFNYMDSFDQITQIYVVATKYFQTDDLTLQNAAGIHGGIGWMKSDTYSDDYILWAAVDFNLEENIIGIAEYISSYGGTDSDAFSFGIRYWASPQWSLQGGWIDGDLHIGTAFIF